MGDRGNIIVIDDVTDVLHPRGVVLYTHWSGTEIKDTLKQALRHEDRWDDAAYLTRIIFDKLRGGDTGTTGYGISSFIGDNEHDFLVVDVKRQVVVTVKADPGVDQTAPEIMRRAMKAKGKSFAVFAGITKAVAT